MRPAATKRLLALAKQRLRWRGRSRVDQQHGTTRDAEIQPLSRDATRIFDAPDNRPASRWPERGAVMSRSYGAGGASFNDLVGATEIDGGTVRPSALAALSPFGPHARSAISAILRNVNTRRRFASGSFAISASVSAIVLPYAWYVGISASGG